MKKEYVVIDKTALQKRIEELEKVINKHVDRAEQEIYDCLDDLMSQSIPLIPEIEKAFDAGRNSSFSSKSPDGSAEKQDYISNLKLDI